MPLTYWRRSEWIRIVSLRAFENLHIYIRKVGVVEQWNLSKIRFTLHVSSILQWTALK